MWGDRKKILKAVIAEKEKLYPKDDLITTYSDFLKIKDELRYFQFNPKVYQSLLKLTLDLWHSEKRISRIALLEKLYQYEVRLLRSGYYEPFQIPKPKPHDSEIRFMLFELYRKTWEEFSCLNYGQIEKARKITNLLLRGTALSTKEEQWFCDNYTLSDSILNRLLRYPVPSKYITNWVRSHFTTPELRIRRAEMISWILDEDPDYVVDIQTLIDDFNYLNELDRLSIKNYTEEIKANQIIHDELGDMLFKVQGYDHFITSDKDQHKFKEPELKLTKRPYHINGLENHFRMKDWQETIEKAEIHFHSNYLLRIQVTMLWAIYYSRLKPAVKSRLYKKFYSNECFNTFYKILRRIDDVKLMKWTLCQIEK